MQKEHGETDCLKIGKWISQDYALFPYLFNLYADYIVRVAGLKYVMILKLEEKHQ